jgi:hypothetical protein
MKLMLTIMEGHSRTSGSVSPHLQNKHQKPLLLYWFVTFHNIIVGRIKHTYVLDDPFDDPPQLSELIPENSPTGKPHVEVIRLF